MLLDLSEILSRVGAHRSYTIEEPPIEADDLVCAGPILGRVTFTNAGNALVLVGEVETSVEMLCSRCLAPMTCPLAVSIAEQFPVTHVGLGGGRAAVPVVQEEEASGAGGLFRGPALDLTEMLRQLISLGLPTQPLHREDCLGLCPTCGRDLNEGPCGCREREPGGPFAQLGELLSEPDKRAAPGRDRTLINRNRTR